MLQACRLFLFCGCILSLEPATNAAPPDKSGVKPSVLSLPSGPGSIEGLGKAFQPQLNTGTATYGIPLKLPPGTAGFAPGIELSYNSGSGNSAFGQGWSCSPGISIERQTDKGFPRYRDADQGSRLRDVFLFHGEELVPLSDGTYRCENENEFRRFRPVASGNNGVDSWLVEDRNGIKHWLGRFGNDLVSDRRSRIPNPAPLIDGGGDHSAFEQTYQWLEDAAEDLNGNRIEYDYLEDSSSPGILYPDQARYFARNNATNQHLAKFLYQTRPDRLSDNHAGFPRVIGLRCREISVASLYAGQVHPVRSYVLSYDPADGALGDLDAASPFSQKRVNLGLSYLHAVTEFDATRSPGGGGKAGNYLPPMRFAYSGFYLQPPPPEVFQALAPLTNRLRADEASPLSSGPVQGVLTQIANPDSEGPLSTAFDLQLENARVQFADMNGDGLPDLLNTETDDLNTLYRVAYNQGDGRFRTSTAVTRSPVLIDLADNSTKNSVTLADADGDGLVDLVQIVDDGGGLKTRIHPNVFDPGRADGATGFASFPITDASTPVEISLGSPNVRQMDLDFDKRPDVLVCNQQGLVGYRAEPGGGWTDLGRQDWNLGESRLTPDYCFSRVDPPLAERSNPLVHLVDMNGDRLLDLVQIIAGLDGRAEVRYRPLIGPMSWGPEITLDFALVDGSPSGIPATLDLPFFLSDPINPHNNWVALQLLDVNGDGLTDFVYVLQNHSVRVYFNCAGQAVLGPFDIPETPVYQPNDPDNPTILRAVDINGNGSTDLVFYHASGGNELAGFRYLEFSGGQKSGLLQVIDNGIGRRTFIRYRASTDDLIRARKSGHPWLTTMPNPVWVVAGMVDDIGLDLNGDGEPDRYTASFDYRDGYYDGFEKQFRGFAYAQKISWGDDVDPASGLPTGQGLGTVSGPTSVTRYRFMTGSPDGADNDQYATGPDVEPRLIDETTERGGREEEALKGKPVWEEAIDGEALRDPAADFDADADATGRAAWVGDPYGLAASRCTPDKYVYSRTHSRWALRRLYRPDGVASPHGRLLSEEPGKVTLDGKSVTFPVLLGATTEIIEANELLQKQFSHPNAPVAARPPVSTGKEFDYDDFGNSMLERDYGVLSGVSPPPDDERVVRRSFILTRGGDGSVDRWIVNRVATERTEDENGVFANETRHYYDGLAFAGLPLGQIGARGLEVRTEQRVKDPAQTVAPLSLSPAAEGGVAALMVPGDPRPESPEWISVSRKLYDPYGNVTFLLDPLGAASVGVASASAGHGRQLAYDGVYHTFPVEERIFVGNGGADLVMRAEYQRPRTESGGEVPWGFGVVTRSIDFNGNGTDYYYDSFARLTAIAKPGDSEVLPTGLFGYRPADPHRGLLYNYERGGALTLGTGPLHGIANSVQTDAREVAGQPGVFTTLSYTDGNGSKLLTLTEDATPGVFNVKGATRYNLRGSALASFQPYQQTGSGFALPAPALTRTDHFADGVGRVIRTLLPPETEAHPDDRRETRTHYLPLTEFSFDEEDLMSTDPAQSHLNTPMVHYIDGLGRLIGVDEVVRLNDDGTPALATVSWPTRYAYDLNDQLVHIRDSHGNQKWFRYDGLGRKLFMNDPDRGTMTYTYDDASNLRETVDAKSQHIQYAYDGVNRLLSEDYLDAFGRTPDVAYHYDVPYANVPVGDGSLATGNNTKGMLAWVQDLSGEEHTSYDARGRVESVVKRIPDPQFLSSNSNLLAPLVSFRTGFAYDSLDRVTALTYPDNDQIGYGYNPRNLLRQITGGVNGLTQGGLVISNIVYQPSDQLARIDYGNGVRTTYAYDPRLRLNSLLTVSQPSTLSSQLINFTYDFDAASNIKSIADNRPTSAVPLGDPRRNTQVFAYDDLYRITRATYNPATLNNPSATNSISYRYDRIGNMMAQNSDIVHLEKGLSVTDLGNLSYGGPSGRANRVGRSPTDAPGPHALTGVSGGSRAYPYDPNGNMTLIDGLTNTWDFKDRLVGVENSEMHADYTYDYTDRRIMKRVWSKTTTDSPSTVNSQPSTVSYPDKYFEVREHDAPTKYVWNGNTRVARVTGSFTTNQRVQRFRLWPGWNLVSLAVTATNALQLNGGASVPTSLLGAYKWNVVTNGWETVVLTASLPANTVLWLKAATNTTAQVTGTYTDPVNRTATAGASFQPGAGLEELPLLVERVGVRADVPLWKFDGPNQTWRVRYGTNMPSQSDFPATLAVGDGFMARVDNSTTLEVPESALRLYYYHEDHLGSSSALTDASAMLVSESHNYAFGLPRKEYEPRNIRDPYQFTQKERDRESQFQYFEARYLHSCIGRFSSVDFISFGGEGTDESNADPQRINPYSYCRNSPVNLTDPNGKNPIALALCAAGAAGKVVSQGVSDLVLRKSPDGCDYAAAAVGGCAAGATAGFTANPWAAAAAGGVAGTATKQVCKKLTGREVDYKEAAVDVASEFAGEAVKKIGGKIAGKILQSKSSGGSLEAITKQMATKLRNGTAANISAKTTLKITKGAVEGAIKEAPRGIALDAVKDKVNEEIKEKAENKQDSASQKESEKK